MKKVLVAEDNKLERRMIIRLLLEHFESKIITDEVEDVERALDFLRRQKYDLVITDLIMPKIEGIELIQIIQKKYHTTKIIAISGGLPYYLVLAKKLGIEKIFTKPLETEKFLSAVAHLLHLNT